MAAAVSTSTTLPIFSTLRLTSTSKQQGRQSIQGSAVRRAPRQGARCKEGGRGRTLRGRRGSQAATPLLFPRTSQPSSPSLRARQSCQRGGRPELSPKSWNRLLCAVPLTYYCCCFSFDSFFPSTCGLGGALVRSQASESQSRCYRLAPSGPSGRLVLPSLR